MTTTANAPAIELRQVVKNFKGSDAIPVRAVRGIDLTIDRGEVVAFLGPNGAGKTTTLDMVLGLTDPTSGSVTTFGATPRDAVIDGKVSAVLQTGGLLHDLTVGETVQLIGSMYRSHAPVDEVIARAGLTKLAGRRVSKCSGGEQQRLRFALALLPNPELLILDEPTAGMDVTARRDFWDTMRADAGSGRTVVFATHYLEEADAFADRIVLIARGEVVADGSTDDIRARASGRTISANLPEGQEAAITERLRAIGGVSGVTLRGQRVTISASDSDAVARALLNDLGARDLEVTTASLEAAFMAITGDPAESSDSDTDSAAKGEVR